MNTLHINVLVENRTVFLDNGARRCEISPPTTVREKLCERWLCEWSFNSFLGGTEGTTRTKGSGTQMNKCTPADRR